MAVAPKYDTPVLEGSSPYFSRHWFTWITRKPAVSPGREIVNGTTLELRHGLGRTPDKVLALLECQEADLGYPAGRRVWISGFEDASDYGASVSADRENLYLTVGANGIRLMQLTGSVGQFAAIANSRWRIAAVAE